MSKVTRLTGGQGADANGQRLHLREPPAEAAGSSDTVGQDLRAARLKRGDELGRISQALRIRKDYLEAIESDWPDRLPGRAYAIGFIRSYANYLELDAPSLVSRYKHAIAGEAETLPLVGPPPEAGSARFGFGWTVLALAVAGMLVYGVYQVSQPGPPSTETVVAPPTGAIVNHAKQNPVSPATGLRRRAAIPVNGVLRGASVSVSGATAAAPPPAPVQAPPDAQAPAVASGEVYGKLNRNVRVVIRARALTRIVVQDGEGKVYINRLLHPGDVYRVPDLVGLSLSTPDGGAVGVELDGRDMGPASAPGGKTEALSLDPQAITERKSGGTGGAE